MFFPSIHCFYMFDDVTFFEDTPCLTSLVTPDSVSQVSPVPYSTFIIDFLALCAKISSSSVPHTLCPLITYQHHSGDSSPAPHLNLL